MYGNLYKELFNSIPEVSSVYDLLAVRLCQTQMKLGNTDEVGEIQGCSKCASMVTGLLKRAGFAQVLVTGLAKIASNNFVLPTAIPLKVEVNLVYQVLSVNVILNDKVNYLWASPRKIKRKFNIKFRPKRRTILNINYRVRVMNL